MPETQGQEANNSASAEQQNQQENQQQAAQGQQQASNNQEIDWSKVDFSKMPESVIKQSPAYKSLLSESVERRQALKQMREQLDQMDGSGETPAKKPVQQQNASQDSDIPAWAQTLMEKVNAIETNTNKNTRTGMVNKAISDLGLPPEVAPYVQGTTAEEIAASAAGLVPLMAKTGGSPGNAGSVSTGVDSLRARLKDRVQGQYNPISPNSPFDVGVQRQKGGGGYFVSKGEE